MKTDLYNKLANIPQKPGCYLWKNKNNEVLYVGKAKNLKKRTAQYFNKANNDRIAKLVSEISDIDFILVNNENESLILENNLIKNYKPKYNVLLKDGSTYPYILITSEKHPRILYTHRYKPNKGKYYGPFAAKDFNAYETFNFLQRIIPLRKCNVIPKTKCIYYDMNQCLGPCINKIDLKQYYYLKKKVADIFNNKVGDITLELQKLELEASNKLDFESAKKYLDLQNSLTSIVQKQVVELNESVQADIIGFYATSTYLSINIFNFVNGKLIAKHEHAMLFYDNETDAIKSYLLQFYTENKIPKKIYVNLDQKYLHSLSEILKTEFISPSKGKYKDLILTAIENAQQYLQKNEFKVIRTFNRTQGAVIQLADILSIESAELIEIVDNSNIFLETCVSGVVVFKNGRPEKKLYRKYKLDYLQQKSDFNFMYEVTKRRFHKKIVTNDFMPNVFVVDGGKIQISAALKALEELELTKIVTVIGLKKDNHHKTDAIVLSNYQEIKLDRFSDLYAFLSNLQNEVHRFAITYFRDKRSKSQFTSIIDKIEGIGKTYRNKILKFYPNILEIDNTSVENLSQIIPHKLAIKLKAAVKEIVNDKNNNSKRHTRR